MDMGKKCYDNYRYVSTFIDKATRYCSLELLDTKDKDSILRHFKHFKNFLENQASTNVKTLLTDNGKEYDNDTMNEFLSKSGIKRCKME